MHFTYEEIRDKLIAAGIKATQQRIVIYEALSLTKKHPRAEDLYEKIRLNNPSISLATVYKTLELFVQHDLVHKVKTQQDSVRYDFNTSKHSHIYCTTTNQIIDFDDEKLQQMLEQYLKSKRIANFKVSDIQVQINGEIINKALPVKLNSI
jgi:Fur family peroxide stress response transcriptional regulator